MLVMVLMHSKRSIYIPKVKHWVLCKNSYYLKFNHFIDGYDYLLYGVGLLILQKAYKSFCATVNLFFI